MEQPQKTNIDATNEIIELDDDAMEQVTGSLSFHIPGIHYQVGVRREGEFQNRKEYPVYKNILTGNVHVQYPNGVRKYEL